MRTTADIKQRLNGVQAEIDRICSIIEQDISNLKKPYIFKSGGQHPEWNYNEALTSFVAQKHALKWVLNSTN